MEHLIFHLIVETIQAIDRKMQRTIQAAVSDLPRLRANPREYLNTTPLSFGPRKRQVLATVIGALIGIVVVGIMLYIFSHMPRQKKVDPWRVAGLIVSFFTVALVSRSVAIRLLHGGSVTLRSQGAEFVQDETLLFIPWNLFDTAGTLFEADHKNVVMPINASIPIVLKDSDGQVRAVMPDDLDTPFAQFGDGQLALKDLYDVRLNEFAALLFELGQRLGVSHEFEEKSWAGVPALAVPESNGWLRILLTQLPFPPICAGCSEQTSEFLPVQIAATRNRSTSLALPFCRTCSQAKKRRQWVAVFVGAGIGLAAGVLSPLFLPGVRRDAALATVVGVLTTITVGVLAILIATLVARARSLPVQVKSYQPAKATLKLRFRRPERSAGLLEAMGIPVIQEKAAAAT